MADIIQFPGEKTEKQSTLFKQIEERVIKVRKLLAPEMLAGYDLDQYMEVAVQIAVIQAEMTMLYEDAYMEVSSFEEENKLDLMMIQTFALIDDMDCRYIENRLDKEVVHQQEMTVIHTAIKLMVVVKRMFSKDDRTIRLTRIDKLIKEINLGNIKLKDL